MEIRQQALDRTGREWILIGDEVAYFNLKTAETVTANYWDAVGVNPKT